LDQKYFDFVQRVLDLQFVEENPILIACDLRVDALKFNVDLSVQIGLESGEQDVQDLFSLFDVRIAEPYADELGVPEVFGLNSRQFPRIQVEGGGDQAVIGGLIYLPDDLFGVDDEDFLKFAVQGLDEELAGLKDSVDLPNGGLEKTVDSDNQNEQGGGKDDDPFSLQENLDVFPKIDFVAGIDFVHLVSPLLICGDMIPDLGTIIK
jgi:hypothetical protein